MLNFQNTIYRNWMTITSYGRRKFSTLLLTKCYWNCVAKVHVDTWQWPSYLELYRTRPYSAGSFHLFVIFRFIFTGTSPVSTDNYICYFVLWTHTLYRELILWYGNETAVWRQFNLLKHCTTVLFHTGFHSAIQTVDTELLNSTENCSNGKWCLIFVDIFFIHNHNI